MEDFRENPDLMAKLAKGNIEIDESITSTPFLTGVLDEELKIGDIGKGGSIIGFSRGTEDPDQLYAVMYREDMEGEPGGVFQYPCNLQFSQIALSSSGELASEILKDLNQELEVAVEMAEMGAPTPLKQIPGILGVFEDIDKIEVPDKLYEALKKVMLEYLQGEEFIEAHPNVFIGEDEDGLEMLMPSGECLGPDDIEWEEE